jgi:hypothetical protein
VDLKNVKLFGGGSLWSSSGNPSEDPGGGKRFRRTYFRVYSGRLPSNFPLVFYLKTFSGDKIGGFGNREVNPEWSILNSETFEIAVDPDLSLSLAKVIKKD